jgi:squalene-hopene/tetraprenyl-beta-curcumene cyclase
VEGSTARQAVEGAAGGVIDSAILDARLDAEIVEAADSLRARQHEDGYWVFDLEADATIPAEYILLNHFLGEPEPVLEAKLATYLRRIQSDRHGGWPLFHDGDFDMSASVKAYFALKLAGDDPDASHMTRARESILSAGGAALSNVFTRITLALFGQVPWRAVPVMPVGIMLLPKWSPFHIFKVSYWSRTVIAPLLILMSEKPQAVNPKGVDIRELFVTPPEEERRYLVNPTGAKLGYAFLALDKVLRVVEPKLPGRARRRAIDAAVDFITERLNGEDGLGGIFPAMANTVMAFKTMGYADDHPDYVVARQSIRKLLVEADEEAWCQPCLSPVWDTSLAMLALMEAGDRDDSPQIRRASAWLRDVQIIDVAGDWADSRPDVAPGGWAFQFRNDFYPDVDDTAVVAMALHRAHSPENDVALQKAADWIIGMQSENGGWGSFDADNTHYYLNHIPFADHGALLDPPTADVSARCLAFLAQTSHGNHRASIERAIAYLRKEQEPDGSWFGRWGTNYIYGTWSVLSAFNAAGVPADDPAVQKAVAWLKSRQRADGGWGEDGATYWEDRKDEVKTSTATQTSWALLGLMAAGEVGSGEVEKGVRFLLDAPHADGKWEEKHYNAVGFPKVFYLLYHGYPAYFPVWALARYRKLRDGNAASTEWGM